MNARELAKIIKDDVKELISRDNGATYKIILDDKLAIYIGWKNGFDPFYEYGFHSKENSEYCVCIKIAKNQYIFMDFGDAYMPWNKDTEEVFDTDVSISPKENYYQLALNLLKDYKHIKKELKIGNLTFGD